MECSDTSLPRPDDCCQWPYTVQWEDCVDDCLRKVFVARIEDIRTKWINAAGLGYSTTTYLNMLIDLQSLQQVLFIVWHEQTMLFEAGTGVQDMTTIWNVNQLSCVANYFDCKYQVSITDALLAVGLYDPANPPDADTLAKLPLFAMYACGMTPPVLVPPVVLPPVDPPPVNPVECPITPAVTVSPLSARIYGYILEIIPATTSSAAASLKIEGLTLGVWMTLYQGVPLDPAVTPPTILMDDQPTAVRYTYTIGTCTYQFLATITYPHFSHDVGGSHSTSYG